MSRIIKWVAIVLGGLIGLVIIAALFLMGLTTLRFNRTYSVQPEMVTIPSDAEAIAQGEYVFKSTCAGCHGGNLGGTAFFDDPALATMPASNLTAGEGGVGAEYSDEDFVRAIRHGIDNAGKPLVIMPAQSLYHFSDEDLGALIAYIRSAPPVDQVWGERQFRPIGRILTALGAFGEIIPAETIDHDAPRPPAPQPGVTAEYGEYLVNTRDCRLCHGPDLTGGQSPEPGAPPGPDLTANPVNWTAEQFIQTMNTGVTPEGELIDPAFMPWPEYAQLNDNDLSAILVYLQSLP
jgi:mono/diheme cytochrome c family protein